MALPALTYDDLLLLAMALESYIAECRDAARSLGHTPVAQRAAAHLQTQIEQAEALLTRLNEARR